MSERLSYSEVAEHKGHAITVEADDLTANIYCDDCGVILHSAHNKKIAPSTPSTVKGG